MKKVIVGMSGGVDSSVAAYLLIKQGYDVEGLFMRNWDSMINNDIDGNPNLNENICPQEQDYNDALKVCSELGIKLHRIDFIKEYWNDVFTYFLNELKNGRTPNPDLMCNKYIKFDLFIKEAKRLEADYIATGHYARTNGKYLYRGLDQSKDQSYFLSYLSQKQLNNVLFPVGDINKTEVRKIAKELNLTTAFKKDSTGICFIGERNYQNFLHNYLKPNPGNIIDVLTGDIIGKHTGLMNYTIGQRKNVGLSGNEQRHFVVGKDINKNILYVAFDEDNEYLFSDSCLIENANFISDDRPTFCTAKFRYRGLDHPVELQYLSNNQILVKYQGLAKSVTPGQACVLYLGEECLGCGIIKTIYRNHTKLWYVN